MRGSSVLLVAVGLGMGVSSANPGLWEQCRSENGTEIACAKGLVCVPDVEYYGLCYTEVVAESEQCGGLGWNVSCVNGTTCERQNEGWASCESTADARGPGAEWQQCDPEDSGNACADSLICVDDDDYRGICVKQAAELWGQCGGSGWTTDCEDGSICEVKTATYSQCVSDDSQSGGGNPSVGNAETLATIAAGLQGTLGVTMSFKSIDVASLVRPLAQLQELATELKSFQCSVRTIIFPDTICDGQAQTRNST